MQVHLQRSVFRPFFARLLACFFRLLFRPFSPSVLRTLYAKKKMPFCKVYIAKVLFCLFFTISQIAENQSFVRKVKKSLKKVTFLFGQYKNSLYLCNVKMKRQALFEILTQQKTTYKADAVAVHNTAKVYFFNFFTLCKHCS